MEKTNQSVRWTEKRNGGWQIKTWQSWRMQIAHVLNTNKKTKEKENMLLRQQERDGDSERVNNSYNIPPLFAEAQRSAPQIKLLLRRAVYIPRTLPRILLQELRNLCQVFRRQLYISASQIFQSTLYVSAVPARGSRLG